MAWGGAGEHMVKPSKAAQLYVATKMRAVVGARRRRQYDEVLLEDADRGRFGQSGEQPKPLEKRCHLR